MKKKSTGSKAKSRLEVDLERLDDGSLSKPEYEEIMDRIKTRLDDDSLSKPEYEEIMSKIKRKGKRG